MDTSIAERVDAGMAWCESDEARSLGLDLDRVPLGPGVLDLSDGDRCVLGYGVPTYGRHSDGFLVVCEWRDEHHGPLTGEPGDPWFRAHGFGLDHRIDHLDEEWPKLTAEWLRRLIERRDARSN